MRIIVFSPYFNKGQNPRRYRLDVFQEELSKKDGLLIIGISGAKKTKKITNLIHSSSILKKLVKLFFKPDPYIFHSIYYLLKYILFYRKQEDTILTVSHPFSMHWEGYILKKYFKHQWYADIGDIAFADNNNFGLLSRTEKMTIENSDILIVNSQSMYKHYARWRPATKPMFVIENGIRIDVSKIKHEAKQNIILAYIGNTYEGIRTGIREAKILIEILEKRSEWKLKMYGKQYDQMVSIFKQSKVSQQLELGFVNTTEELEKVYSEISCLILMSNARYPNIPSKVQEYLASSKAIIYFIESKDDTILPRMQAQAGTMCIDMNEVKIDEIITFIENHRSKIIERKKDTSPNSWLDIIQ